MNLLLNYQNALEAIYDHVGFVEDWVVYPLDDRTDDFWTLLGDEEVHYGPSIEEIEMYSSEIYHQRFYEKAIYRGEELTLIFTNPGVDGMKYFSIFNNAKEIKG